MSVLKRTCAHCGEEFIAKRPTAKYCGTTCRTRATRARESGATAAPIVPADHGFDEVPSGLIEVTRRTLDDSGVLDTVSGQSALLLAARLGSNHETGAAMAALSKQLEALVASALASVSRADRMDEVTRRRDEKLRRAREA